MIAASRWEKIGPAFGWIAVCLVAVALYMIFVYAPIERVQGIVQKIFYLHLSMVLSTYLAFVLTAVASVFFLVRRDRRWDLVAHSSADIGVFFCTLLLITGILWGKPIWGVWWTWDPNLTGALVLWLIFLGYVMLRRYFGDSPASARFAALLAIIGVIDIPIIHYSLQLLRGIHPRDVVRSGLPHSMAQTLLVTLLAFLFLYLFLLYSRIRVRRLRDALQSAEWAARQA